jgi:threonine dehydratase
MLRKSDWLSEELRADVYLKLECLQPGRSFKIRGATHALLSRKTRPSKVITASGGNHGLGVAIACNQQGVPCMVVLPTTTSSYRIELLKTLGAEVFLYGEAWDEANNYAMNLALDPDVLYIHPFADRAVMLGQGTISFELVEQLGEFNVLVASVGGGGLLSGISLNLEAMGKSDNIDIFSVETRGAESLAKSLELNELIELPAITSIAKTLGARKTTPFIFGSLSRLVNKYFVIDDADAVKAIYQFLDHEKILVEPATSCIISAALANKELFVGKRVVFIICGSNVTLDEVEEWKKQFLE